MILQFTKSQINDDKCKDRIEKFKVVDDLLRKNVYGMNGPRPPKLLQQTTKKSKNEFETTWQEFPPIEEGTRKDWVKFAK